jgi:hypothetical protein
MTRQRSRIDEARDRLRAEIAEKKGARDLLDMEIVALERAIELLAEPPAQDAKKRAKPGAVEAAIVHKLGDGALSADAIVAALHFNGANPESVRGALRRMVGAGRIAKDGDQYALPAPAAEAAQ